jgi:hypothetical protein
MFELFSAQVISQEIIECSIDDGTSNLAVKNPSDRRA